MSPDHNEEMEREYSDQMHRAHDPHYIQSDDIVKAPDDVMYDDDGEIQIECPYCQGDGWNRVEGIAVECAECGGTGWE